jgi:hypothetical protein
MKGIGIEWGNIAPCMTVKESPEEFWLGRVVSEQEPPILGTRPRLGHITGFSRNFYDEIVIVVKWCDGQEYPTHPANVNLH